jgi:hypothetical protein
VADWSIARDPGVRLRDIAARTGVTERTAHGIATDLTEAGYVVKHKDGRRYRYQIQAHLPLPETHPASHSDCPHAKPTRPGRQPSNQEARLTCVPETLRHTGAASSNPHRHRGPPGGSVISAA